MNGYKPNVITNISMKQNLTGKVLNVAQAATVLLKSAIKHKPLSNRTSFSKPTNHLWWSTESTQGHFNLGRNWFRLKQYIVKVSQEL